MGYPGAKAPGYIFVKTVKTLCREGGYEAEGTDGSSSEKASAADRLSTTERQVSRGGWPRMKTNKQLLRIKKYLRKVLDKVEKKC